VAAPEYEQVAGERILPQQALHQHGEPITAPSAARASSSRVEPSSPRKKLSIEYEPFAASDAAPATAFERSSWPPLA
jgi:hypothetical protein